MHLGMQWLQDVLDGVGWWVGHEQPDASALEPGRALSGTAAHVELDPGTSVKDYWQTTSVAAYVSSH